MEVLVIVKRSELVVNRFLSREVYSGNSGCFTQTIRGAGKRRPNPWPEPTTREPPKLRKEGLLQVSWQSVSVAGAAGARSLNRAHLTIEAGPPYLVGMANTDHCASLHEYRTMDRHFLLLS